MSDPADPAVPNSLPPTQSAVDNHTPIDSSAAPVAGGRALSYALLGLVLCTAGFQLIYHGLVKHRMHQGAALFIGLPVILGTIIALTTRPRSTLGMVFKMTALVLCVLAPAMQEGAVCIVIFAPILFAVMGLVAFLSSLLGRHLGKGKVGCCALLLGLSPMVWERAEKLPGWEDLRPISEATDSVVLLATPQQVWEALAKSPQQLQQHHASLPGFMQLRLTPGRREVQGEGLQVGATRHIYFDSDHFVGTVTHAEPGREVVFSVSEQDAGPGERISLWLRFVEVRFVVQDLGGGRTLLQQQTRYRRLLDPAFYFAPIERYGVHAMHRYTLPLLTRGLRAASPVHG
jgi:uncharacterized protein YndB with AHSA1/START domain